MAPALAQIFAVFLRSGKMGWWRRRLTTMGSPNPTRFNILNRVEPEQEQVLLLVAEQRGK